jgi:hypothetical protein
LGTWCVKRLLGNSDIAILNGLLSGGKEFDALLLTISLLAGVASVACRQLDNKLILK